jgi:hypothetical protein
MRETGVWFDIVIRCFKKDTRGFVSVDASKNTRCVHCQSYLGYRCSVRNWRLAGAFEW